MRRRLALVLVALSVLGCSSASQHRVLVAAGTTIADNGFLERLSQVYESEFPGVEISILGQPTALAIELGMSGDADMIITHAPAQEAEFIEEGFSSADAVVFESVFVLVGPQSLKTEFSGLEAPEVLRTVAERGLAFVSRGDGSGTWEKEQLTWLEAGLNPVGQSWFIVTETGMGPTLQVADQREAVVFSELGAFLAAKPSLSLVVLEVDPGGLTNPYRAMVVGGAAAERAASDFLEWLISDDGKTAIAQTSLELFSADIYRPAQTTG